MAWQGEGCISKFLYALDAMVSEQYKLHQHLCYTQPALTGEDLLIFENAKECPCCKKEFKENRCKKEKNYCPLTNAFKGVICSGCKYQFSTKYQILPVIFHNFKGYDSHMLLKHGIELMKHWKLTVVSQTSEKFMTLRADVPVSTNKDGSMKYFKVVFIDSFQFMSSSLSNLIKNLNTTPITDRLKEVYPLLNDDTIHRKGVFPYSYLDSYDRLEEKQLPPIDAFYNNLSNEQCSEADYEYAFNAWHEFECQTLGDYMMRYLQMDVYLLADVFEEFRKITLQEDGLDPVHFISLPSLTYMSCFKMTEEHIELLTDPLMYDFFERGIRGGLTFTNCHSQRSHQALHEGDLNTHLLYIDENNLYGSALRIQNLNGWMNKIFKSSATRQLF